MDKPLSEACHSTIFNALNRIHTSAEDAWSELRPYQLVRSYCFRKFDNAPLQKCERAGAAYDHWIDLDEAEGPLAALDLVVVVLPKPETRFKGTFQSDHQTLQKLFTDFALPEAALAAFLKQRITFNHFGRGMILPHKLIDALPAYYLSLRQWCMCWSFDTRRQHTRAVLLLDHGSWSKEMERWLPFFLHDLDPILESGITPGILAVMLCLTRTIKDLQKLDKESPNSKKALEEITHGRNSQDYGQLSAEQSWFAIRASKFRHRLLTIQTCLDQLRTVAVPQNGTVSETEVLCQDILQHLELTTTSMLAQTTRQTEQSSLLLSALWNLIAQRDQTSSLQLAKTSAEIAQESRNEQSISTKIAKASQRIAEETKRDSASMKTIAAVTMLFLPGTFLASCFSMPLFDWSAPSSLVISPRIWLYWVLTITLTLLTMVGYWAWVCWDQRNEKDTRRASADEKSIQLDA